MIQREGVLTQQSRAPALGGMAILALQAKESGMNVRLGMAVNTPGGSAFVAVDVTGLAIDLGVFPFQRKPAGMLKVCHAVHAVVAIQAVFSDICLMGKHKFRLRLGCLLTMAVKANTCRKISHRIHMAVTAQKCLPGKIHRMVSQAKSRRSEMLERLPFPHDVPPPLGTMAGRTIVAKQSRVHFGFRMAILALSGNLRKLLISLVWNMTLDARQVCMLAL